MALNSPETLTSLNFNFSSSGGDHSMTTESVINAKDLAQDGNNLGTIIGSESGRITASNGKIQQAIQNFVVTKETTSKNGTLTTVSREYANRTSLLLKSNCFLVRGSQGHPRDGEGEITVPYFSECTNTPVDVNQRFPRRGPSYKNGIVRIGNIYNEESSVDSDGVKTSLVYQNQILQEDLCYNLTTANAGGGVSSYYIDNPDYANYDLRFGYTLNEAIQGFGMCGIKLDVPNSNANVLFEESGTLDAIVSNIASKFGYYWFIDPFTNVVKFINSIAASTIAITNPLTQSQEIQKSYVDASFTKDRMSPVFVNAFSGNIEKQKQTFEYDQGERFTRFRKLPVDKVINKLKITENLLKLYYTMWLAGAYNKDNFDVLGIIATRLSETITWKDQEWNGSSAVKSSRAGDISILLKNTRMIDALNKDGQMDLRKAKFISLANKTSVVKIERPSQGTAFSKIDLVLRLLHNTIYVSNFYRQYSARRTNWAGSEMSISGPFLKTTKIKEIEALADLHGALGEGRDEITLEEIMEFSGSTGGGDYGFIGILNGSNRASRGLGLEDLNFGLFNNGEYRYVNAVNEHLGYTEELSDKIKSIMDVSPKIFNDQDKEVSGPSTAKAYFTRSKRPTDEIADDATREEEEERAEKQAQLDAAAQKLAELAERYDIRYYSVKNNGSTGNIYSPIRLDIKSGKIADIKALENSQLSAIQSLRNPTSQSSRTIVGISLPTAFQPTISGISLKLGGSGVTTTIDESTVKLLRPDEQLIIDRNLNAFLTTRNQTNFRASQKNFLGL
tara:strand:- start:8285 stop:10651 length:2367 start_codon:yes stop_codon:yes gene_type:complete